MKRRQRLNKAIDTANDHIKVADMTMEIDSITETIEVSLLNHILNKEIKGRLILKKTPIFGPPSQVADPPPPSPYLGHP